MWRVTLALLFACSTALGQPPPPVSSGTANTNASQTAANPVEISNETLVAIQQAIETIAANSTPKNDPQQYQALREIQELNFAEFDLDAQRSMAKFTEYIFIISFAGFVVGVFTVVFLGITIIQAREGIQTAIRGAKAAEDTVRQDRAWVSPILPPKFEFIDYTDEVNHQRTYDLRVKFILQNTSNTPANNIEVWRYEYPDSEGLEPEQIPLPLTSSYVKGEQAGFLTKTTNISISARFNEHFLRGYLEGNYRLYLFFKINWKTVFNEVGTTYFNAEVLYTEDKTRALLLNRPTLDHWALSPIGQNCRIHISAETDLENHHQN